MPSTIPNEHDRLLTEAERALIKVRQWAFAAAELGESRDRILAEASHGVVTAARIAGRSQR